MSTATQINGACFPDTFIGIQGQCDANASTSGLFINDTGISLNELNELATEDFKNGVDLFKKKLLFSIQEVTRQLHTRLQPQYRARSVIENSRNGWFQDDLKMTNALAGYFRLMQFELINTSSFVDLFISEISLQLDYTGNVDISVFDLMTGLLVDTITINCTPNEVCTVYPYKLYKSNRKKLNLIFAYESEGKPANTTWLTRSGGNCAGCNGQNYYQNEYVRIRGGKMLTSNDKLNKSVVATSDTGGMSIVYSLSCNHTDWLCSISNVIALPILWKTAAAIMEHGVLITPLEQITPRTQSSHIYHARFNSYLARFEETFEAAVKNITLPSDVACFKCANRIRSTYAIPS